MARARSSAPDAAVVPGRMKPEGMVTSSSSSPIRPVVPPSPVPVSSSIRFLRARGPAFLLEDLAEVVQLLGHPPCFFDDLGQRDDLDVSIAPDRDDPTLAGDDQLDRRDAEPRRPDAVHR